MSGQAERREESKIGEGSAPSKRRKIGCREGVAKGGWKLEGS